MKRLHFSRRTRLGLYAVAVLTTPVLHGLGFPPANLGAVAWVAMVPWFAAIRVAGWATALGLSALITLAGSYTVASWLPDAVVNYYRQPLVVGMGVFVGVWAVTVAPAVLAFTVCYRALARRAVVTLPLLAGAAWAASEFGRVRLLVGDPFGLFGYSQVDCAPLVQISEVTGVYGVSFVLAAVTVALAELALPIGSRRRVTGDVIAGLGLVAVVVIGVLAYGSVELRRWADVAPQPPPTRVAIVQGNLDLGSQWRSEFYGRNLEDYLRLTLRAQQDDAAALVVWPESAMTFFLQDEPSYQRAIGAVLSQSGAQLLAGGPRAVPRPIGAGKPAYYNSALLIAPSGGVLGWYDKQQLLPFAEDFPFGGSELLRREFARVREFSPGGATPPLRTVAGTAGVVICNEVMFPEIVAARVRAGADYVVNLSNDTWLGDRKFALEALDMARLRAVEQRRYLVRASTSGPSAIIDPLGRVQVRTQAASRDTVSGSVQGNGQVTLYGRYGDVFAVVCAIVPLAVLIIGARRAGV